MEKQVVLKTVSRRLLLIVLSSLFVILSMPMVALADIHLKTEYGINRRWGDDRYESAAAVAFYFRSPSLVVASGENFPDALCATALAGQTGSKVLFANSGDLPQATESFVKKGGFESIYVIGGEDAVSAQAYAKLGELVGDNNILRVFGSDRYETAKAIYDSYADSWSETCIVVQGERSAADSISISPYASVSKSPIFITYGNGTLPQSALDAISSGSFTSAIVVGGDGAVSQQTEAWLEKTLGTENVLRLSGADRYETSANVALWTLGEMPDACIQPATSLYWNFGVVFVSGADRSFADGICGSLATRSENYETNRILLLVDPQSQDGGTAVRQVTKGRFVGFGGASMVGGYETISEELERTVALGMKWV